MGFDTTEINLILQVIKRAKNISKNICDSLLQFSLLLYCCKSVTAINKEESSIREGSKKSNLEGDTEGENLKEQENNNKLLNKIKTTIYNNNHNNTS